VLELRRPLSVDGDGGPVVGPSLVLPFALVDHRLDGENVPRSHDTLLMGEGMRIIKARTMKTNEQ